MEQKQNVEQGAGGKGLDDYLRAGSPGVLITVCALLLVVAALLIWGFVGTLPVTETVTGFVGDPEKTYSQEEKSEQPILDRKAKNGDMIVVCFLDASRYNMKSIEKISQTATIEMPDQNKFSCKILGFSDVPVSREEAKKFLPDSDWLAERCIAQEYSWVFALEPEEDISLYEYMLAQVTFQVDNVPPIRFLVR